MYSTGCVASVAGAVTPFPPYTFTTIANFHLANGKYAMRLSTNLLGSSVNDATACVDIVVIVPAGASNPFSYTSGFLSIAGQGTLHVNGYTINWSSVFPTSTSGVSAFVSPLMMRCPSPREYDVPITVESTTGSVAVDVYCASVGYNPSASGYSVVTVDFYKN